MGNVKRAFTIVEFVIYQGKQLEQLTQLLMYYFIGG